MALQGIDSLPGMQGIAADVTSSEPWRAWATCADPATEPLPGRWGVRRLAPGDEGYAADAPAAPAGSGGLTIFQRLLVVRALRDEKTVQAVREFVRLQLDESYCTPPPFDLDGAFGDSTSQSPIIFVLSPGADPIDYLLKLAKAKGKAGPGLRMISLGQGQGPIAERMMDGARRSGDWVVLQNCHLAVSWLPRMEALLEAAGASTGEHPDYRLWLTSMPSKSFPVPVLQNGIKLTNEPPRGLRANLMRTFLDVTVKDYDSCSKSREFKKLLFGLAFYHALILERRKFGAIGWNISYDWMNSDLKTGTMQLRMYLEEQPTVPFETLNAVVGDITYGGRVTDKWDKRTNLSVLRRFFAPPILEDGSAFSDSGVYFAPPAGTLASVRAYVEELPPEDKPEVFGLHANAEISLQLKETSELMDTLLSMQPRAGGGALGGAKGPDDIVLELAEAIAKRLPKPFSKKDAHPLTFATIDDGSVNSSAWSGRIAAAPSCRSQAATA